MNKAEYFREAIKQFETALKHEDWYSMFEAVSKLCVILKKFIEEHENDT